MILAIDQGTTGTTCLVFDTTGGADRPRIRGVRAALPAAGVGRARSRRDLGRSRTRSPAAPGRRGPAPGELTRSGSPTSARRCACGTRATGRAAAPGDRLAGPPHGRRAARSCARRATSRSSARGPGSCSIRISRRRRSSGCSSTSTGCASARGTGGRVFGTVDTCLLFQLTGRARDRRHQRLADAAVRHQRPAPGTASCWSCSGCPSAPCRGRAQQRRHRRDAAARAARPRGPGAGVRATSRRRCSARRASTRGIGKNTYGTGSFVLQNTGYSRPSPPQGLLTTVAWRIGEGRLAYALEAAIFVTGAAVQWLRDGLGIIATRGDRGARARSIRGQRRRVLRARADRAGVAALGSVRRAARSSG